MTAVGQNRLSGSARVCLLSPGADMLAAQPCTAVAPRVGSRERLSGPRYPMRAHALRWRLWAEWVSLPAWPPGPVQKRVAALICVIDGRSTSRRSDRGAVHGAGRVARTPRLAVAEDVVEPNLYLPWPAHTDGVGTFHSNDFELPAAISRIIVVQNLSRLQHHVPCAPSTDHGKPTWLSQSSRVDVDLLEEMRAISPFLVR
jgi:hypothetical protein